jgi:hypothetical protein
MPDYLDLDLTADAVELYRTASTTSRRRPRPGAQPHRVVAAVRRRADGRRGRRPRRPGPARDLPVLRADRPADPVRGGEHRRPAPLTDHLGRHASGTPCPRAPSSTSAASVRHHRHARHPRRSLDDRHVPIVASTPGAAGSGLTVPRPRRADADLGRLGRADRHDHRRRGRRDPGRLRQPAPRRAARAVAESRADRRRRRAAHGAIPPSRAPWRSTTTSRPARAAARPPSPTPKARSPSPSTTPPALILAVRGPRRHPGRHRSQPDRWHHRRRHRPDLHAPRRAVHRDRAARLGRHERRSRRRAGGARLSVPRVMGSDRDQ